MAYAFLVLMLCDFYTMLYALDNDKSHSACDYK